MDLAVKGDKVCKSPIATQQKLELNLEMNNTDVNSNGYIN